MFKTQFTRAMEFVKRNYTDELYVLLGVVILEIILVEALCLFVTGSHIWQFM